MNGETKLLVDQALTALGINRAIRHTFTETTDSPWKESIHVKRKKDHVDTKLTYWHDDNCLYGRLYRLLLYVSDVLDPAFGYDSIKTPKQDEQPSVWELYKQIWGIYVDGRLERQAIPNFYTRDIRRNLFVDLRKDLAWDEASAVFHTLWTREAFTHREILQYAESLDKVLRTEPEPRQHKPFEVEVNEFHRGLTVRHHLEKLAPPLRDVASEILSFTAYNCKGTLIYPVYFGIRFKYERKVFAELIASGENRLLLTLTAFHGDGHTTYEITDPSQLQDVQKSIKDAFTIYHLDSGDQ